MLGLGAVNVAIAAPLAGGAAPVVTPAFAVDQPNPRGPDRAIELRTWAWSTPLNLIGQDMVFGGPGQAAPAYDWPNPRGYVPGIELRTWTHSFPLALIGADQFFAAPGMGPTYDWPNPRGAVPPIALRTWLQASYALQLFTPTYGLGGIPNFDQPNPRGPQRVVDLLTWINPLPIDLFYNPGTPALAFISDRASYIASASDSPSGQDWRGPGFMGIYEIDTIIQLTGTFINANTGVYIDPTGVNLFVLDPSGAKSTFQYTGLVTSQIIRDSIGHYHVVIQVTKSGVWTYKWQATGSAVASSPDTVFTVNSSTLLAG